jgi:hypothetical protein
LEIGVIFHSGAALFLIQFKTLCICDDAAGVACEEEKEGEEEASCGVHVQVFEGGGTTGVLQLRAHVNHSVHQHVMFIKT